MDYFSLVKRYYDRGYYTEDQVCVFVRANKITLEQYTEITSQEYGGV